MLYISDLTDQLNIDGSVNIKVFEDGEQISEESVGSIYAVPEELTRLEIAYIYADADELVIEVIKD